MWDKIPPQTHNEFLQIAVELGLLALAAFLLFWLLFALRLGKCLKAHTGEAEFYLLLGAGSGILGTLFNSLFTFPLQTVTSATFFWSTTGLLLARCIPGNGQKAHREIELHFKLTKPVSRIIAASGGLLVLAVCLWFSTRIIRAQYLFFDALKTHARHLSYSLQRNREAADLLPYHFEMQYVQGWLAQLAKDSTQAREFYERSIQAAPFFPEPYKYLAETYYLNGDLRKAEKTLQAYERVYSPGVPERSHFLWGLICLRDTTRDRLDEADSHLRQAGGGDPLLILAEVYYSRGMLDSTLSILKIAWPKMSPSGNKELFLRGAYLYGLTALELGDTATARDRLNLVIRHGSDDFGLLVENSRKILAEINARKK